MKKTIILIIASVIVILSMTSGIMDKTGKVGKTKSPGENTCNESGCHTGNPLNDPGGSITITAPSLTAWQYTPGQVYTINVIVARAGVSLFGFDFEALTSTGANAGTITVTDAATTQVGNITVLGNSRKNITHKLNGGLGTTDFHTFTFSWTAPASDIGNITFYAAGNATNSSNTNTGDFIYNTSQVVSPVSSTDIFDKSISNIKFSVYPNPVVESTIISYQLTQNSNVSARLISLTGQTVITFFNEAEAVGVHKKILTIDSSIAKGTYIVVLDVDESRSYKKIVIN